MGRADRREAQDAPVPARIGGECTRIETAHAMANQVHRLAGKLGVDLLAELLRATIHPRHARNLRHQHPVSRRSQ
jgi:hypothetical protein